eukprot:8593293-Alexandrium_andersonii.AAC.1
MPTLDRVGMKADDRALPLEPRCTQGRTWRRMPPSPAMGVFGACLGCPRNRRASLSGDEKGNNKG